MGAAAQPAIARPPAGELVTDQVLYGMQMSTLSLAQSFAGTTNPSTIWQEMVGDSRNAYAYYRELEEKDDDVGAAIEEMKLSVLRRERQLVAADDSSLAAEIRDFIAAQFDRVDMDGVVDYLLDAPFYGMAIAEMIFEPTAGAVGLVDIRDCPQELFTFASIIMPQTGPLRFLPNGLPQADGGQVVPEEKFLLFSYRPRSRNRRGQPLLRKVFWLSWFKRQVLKFWLRAGEKGPGTAAVSYPSGATDAEKQQALAMAEAIISKVAIAVPENAKIMEALLTGARAQNPGVYAQLFSKLQYSIARRIKGETLTSFGGSESGTGSRSMGDTHSETKEERSVSFCTMIERIINDQLVRRLVLWNYGPNAPMPRWAIEKNPPQDLKQRAEIDNTLQAMGVPIPKSYAQETYGIPDPVATDEVLVRSASATAPMQATGTGLPAFSDAATVKRELADVDRLLSDAQKKGQDMLRERVMQLVAEVLPQ